MLRRKPPVFRVNPYERLLFSRSFRGQACRFILFASVNKLVPGEKPGFFCPPVRLPPLLRVTSSLTSKTRVVGLW